MENAQELAEKLVSLQAQMEALEDAKEAVDHSSAVRTTMQTI